MRFGWTLAGGAPGRPGNAHSGYSYLEEEDDFHRPAEVAGTLIDWQCPQGAIPPVYGFKSPDCQFEASISIGRPISGGGQFGRYLIKNRIKLSVPIKDTLTGSVDRGIDVRSRGLKPLKRTDTYLDERRDRHRTRMVTVSREAVPSGHLVWLNLGDPGLQVVDPWVKRVKVYRKALDGAS